MGAWIDKYFSDGSYEVIGKSWDADKEEWVQSAGYRGTYEYDASTYTIKRTRIEDWGVDGAEGWVKLQEYYAAQDGVTAWSVVISFNRICTTEGVYPAYIADSGNTWKSTFLVEDKITEDGVETLSGLKGIETYTLSGDELEYSRINQSKDRSASEWAADYEEERGGEVYRLAPTDIEWKTGKTVTFWYTETIARNRNWNDDTGVWNEWNSWAGNDMRSKTFTHMGDFILEISYQSMKSLF